MRGLFHQWLFGWLMILVLAFQALSQNNLIVNGDFSVDDSGWNDLGLYNEGQGSGKVENGAYIIDITAPGTDVWSIQFTQTHITLDSGTAYTLSYEASSSIERTIEVSLSRNGGDYATYSGRDTLSLNNEQQSFERTFVMRQPTDQDVRLEFNCGKATGKITIRNVRLVKYTDQIMRITAPGADEILYEGVPYTVAWSSINVNKGIKIDFSIDNGDTWKTIGTLNNDSGSFVWVPGATYSPWCRIRVSSLENDSVFDLNEGPFEVAPLREMVKGGSFSRLTEKWSFGVYDGSATGEIIHDSLYRVNIENSADEYWQIQLTQNGIPLEHDQRYRFSFTAYAENPTDIKINIGMDHEPFSSYFDTTQWIVALSTTPQQHVFLFTMKEQSDSNCRLEFNFGKSSGEIFIDQVSLVPQYVASTRFADPITAPALREQTQLLITGKYRVRFAADDNHPRWEFMQVIDLKGRTLGILRKQSSAQKRGTVTERHPEVPGIYLLKKGRPIR